MVDDPPPAADTYLSKQRTPLCRPSCDGGAINWNSIDHRCSCVVHCCDGIPTVSALVHRALAFAAKKVLRCEPRSPLCTPQPQIARTPSPSKGAMSRVASCKLQVASYLCSTNVHCVDGEPICANNDLHSECTTC